MFEWDIGISMLSEVDADGFISLQRDAEGEAQSGVAPYEGHHMLGFMARPMDPVVDEHGAPDPAQGCQLLFAHEAGRGHAFALGDPRYIPTLPTLQKGESMQYGCAGQFIRCHADGSVTVMTTDTGGSEDGSAVFLRVRPGELRFHAPWGKLIFDASGFHVTTQGGARFSLGAVSGLPAPFDAIGNYANLAAAMVSINGQTVSVGPSVGGDPAVQSTPLLAYLAQVVGALEAVSAALVTFIPGAGGAAIPGASAAASAISALSAPPLIQSSTTVA